ncbi:MAG: XdhC family protein [Candidatus Poseidoniales archaeon]|nr:MAG: XdhC family protein [Candidatus Poseidoniales archaeon]
MTAAVMAWALMQLSAGQRVVLASVVQTSGSVPGKIGARLAMSADSQWQGTVGGAGLEMKVLSRCKELLEEHTKPYGEVLRYGLNKGAKGYEVTPLDSLCGGQVTLAVEVLIPMPHVLLMGGGHCGQAIAHSLDALGWNHSVHDTRPEFANLEKYPNAKHHFPVTVESFFASENFESICRFSDILLLGHDWSEDQDRLLGLLHLFSENKAIPDGRSAPRIGVIGSRSKWQAFEKECINNGLEQHLLDNVICPIGLNIGAESPEEIAVAVVAQIMALFKETDAESPTWRN